MRPNYIKDELRTNQLDWKQLLLWKAEMKQV